VRIFLPREREEARAVSGNAADEPPKGGTETVLLVEDDEGVLFLGEEILRRLGYTVLKAATPEDAIELAARRGGSIDLLITDVVMPQMDGRALAERLMSTHPSMKCLFMSGYTADVIAKHGVLEPEVCFIQKPFSMRDLATKAREALNGEGGRGDPNSKPAPTARP
jgi:DNA-binding NtrC family response regulator